MSPGSFRPRLSFAWNSACGHALQSRGYSSLLSRSATPPAGAVHAQRRSSPSGRLGYDGVSQQADPLDLDLADISRLEENLWVAGHSNT